MEENIATTTTKNEPVPIASKSSSDNTNQTVERQNPDELNVELKYSPCKYCRGIIPRYPRRNPNNVHCGKICSETNKMVSTDNYTYSEYFDMTSKDWTYYKEVLKEKTPPATNMVFSQITRDVLGLEPGMKLEALDINNPVNFCVATVIQVKGHRLCIRYDGFGSDSKYDFWCNFQAEELYPIGWCAQRGYALQPPTGITSTLSEWKSFLTRTLTGALASPPDLFRKADERRQLRCHPYNNGNRVEVIHPKRPDLIVSASISKSLGPYYFLVKTDLLPGVPVVFFYGYADCPGIYPAGWCESRGLELIAPAGSCLGLNDFKCRSIVFIEKGCSSFQEPKMYRRLDVNTETPPQKRSRLNPFKIGQKLEVVDNTDVRVATVAEIFGRVAMVLFDGTDQRKFVDKFSTDVFPCGWCENTGHLLITPYGKGKECYLKTLMSKFSDAIHSASFISFQNAQGTSPAIINSNLQDMHQTTSTPPPPPLSEMNQAIQQQSAEQTNITSPPRSCTPSQNNTDAELLDVATVDDMEIPMSPHSPAMAEQQKYDMEKFIVWLLNYYVYDSNDSECVIKPELVDHFTENTHVRLSPRWFSLIYKLFAVGTVRRQFDGKFVNCFRNLRLLKNVNPDTLLYVKDAVDLFRSERIRVIVGEDKVVAFLGVGNSYHLPEDTHDIFTYGKAKPNSNVLVIVAEVSGDYRLQNFTLFYETNPCFLPLQNVKTVHELRALVKLCKGARTCRGLQIIPKADQTTPNYRRGRYVKHGRLYSSCCNTIAFAHKDHICYQCKSLRSHNRPSPQLSVTSPAPEEDSLDVIDRDDIDDGLGKGEEDDNVPSPDLRIYFNNTCYPGIYLDPSKVSKMKHCTQLDRPAQILKFLVEDLINVAVSKDKLLEIIEAGFGTRIFNKAKDKVVKKGLFRFNTRRKVLRFLKRLTKRLNCCEFFLSIDPRECTSDCKKTGMKTVVDGKGRTNQQEPSSSASGPPVTLTLSSPSSSSSSSSSVQRSNVPLSAPVPQTNPLQLVYQLPVGAVPVSSNNSSSTPITPGTPTIMVQTPDGMKIPNRIAQGTHFFVPSSGNNVTYMVVTKENMLTSQAQNIYSSSAANTPMSTQSPGVTNMIANVSKTHLVSDIDNPSVQSNNRMSQISVVKGGGLQNQQILVKKTKYDYPYASRSDDVKHPRMDSSSPLSPPSYQDATRSFHYPRSQSANYPPNEPNNSDQRIHVHKVHHGNARVKYVEFKPPTAEGAQQQQQQQQQRNPQHYNPGMKQQQQHPPQQQQIHYPHRQHPHQSQHLTVHTQGQGPKSPLHSPPALRPPPPPAAHQRQVALSSPPNLVPSPEIRPRFNFANSPQSPSMHNSPGQVTGKHPHLMKPIHGSNQTITLPKLASNYQLSPLAQPNSGGLVRPQANYQQSPNTPDGNPDNRYSSPSSGAMTPATMTYIPIQTSSKDKFVYVPVQSGQNQQVVLLPNNKDGSGKPMFIAPQGFQKTIRMPDQSNRQQQQHMKEHPSGGQFTTVRIQGVHHTSSYPPAQNSPNQPVKSFKFQPQPGQNITGTLHQTAGGRRYEDSPNNQQQQQQSAAVYDQEKGTSQDVDVKNQQHPQAYDRIKQEEHSSGYQQQEKPGEIMNIISDQLRRVPPHIGIRNQPDPKLVHTANTNKMRMDIAGAPIQLQPANLQSPNTSQAAAHAAREIRGSVNDAENTEVKVKKRRGRPVGYRKNPGGPRSKLSMMQVNPLNGSTNGNPITLANRVLTETYYKKQQHLQNRANFLKDPLSKLPNLPSNPEKWSPEDVYTFLMETDCSSYASLLKNEEIDGKSFLLMTREALMEFMGMKLGPALKISGHASYLRARHRMQTMSVNSPNQSNRLEHSVNVAGRKRKLKDPLSAESEQKTKIEIKEEEKPPITMAVLTSNEANTNIDTISTPQANFHQNTVSNTPVSSTDNQPSSTTPSTADITMADVSGTQKTTDCDNTGVTASESTTTATAVSTSIQQPAERSNNSIEMSTAHEQTKPVEAISVGAS